jgi:hypothetical protein
MSKGILVDEGANINVLIVLNEPILRLKIKTRSSMILKMENKKVCLLIDMIVNIRMVVLGIATVV